jgi:hypothetical protein
VAITMAAAGMLVLLFTEQINQSVSNHILLLLVVEHQVNQGAQQHILLL